MEKKRSEFKESVFEYALHSTIMHLNNFCIIINFKAYYSKPAFYSDDWVSVKGTNYMRMC